MCREIQYCFDMSRQLSITVKQMSLESVFERSQRLQISDVTLNDLQDDNNSSGMAYVVHGFILVG